MIDRQFDQLGKVLVCVNAVTIRYRGRATRSIDHNTHGHRLGQDKAQAGFEGSQEAGALDEEIAIASTPSSVRLVSKLRTRSKFRPSLGFVWTSERPCAVYCRCAVVDEQTVTRIQDSGGSK